MNIIVSANDHANIQIGGAFLTRNNNSGKTIWNRFLDKSKNEIQNSILRFCFYFNKEDEIQKVTTIFMFNRFFL